MRESCLAVAHDFGVSGGGHPRRIDKPGLDVRSNGCVLQTGPLRSYRCFLTGPVRATREAWLAISESSTSSAATASPPDTTPALRVTCVRGSSGITGVTGLRCAVSSLVSPCGDRVPHRSDRAALREVSEARVGPRVCKTPLRSNRVGGLSSHVRVAGPTPEAKLLDRRGRS